MTTARTHTTIRPAVTGDIDDIATVWHTGWRDAHLGRVPSSLLAHRQLGDLRVRVPVRLDTTSVASVGSCVAGFVVTHLDEIEQLYLHAAFRGTGIAAELLAHGEGVIVAGFDRAWLAVVDGNARARRFYERHGWIDTGMFDNPAWMPDGTTIPVPSRRYEKHLADPARRAPHALRRASALDPPTMHGMRDAEPAWWAQRTGTGRRCGSYGRWLPGTACAVDTAHVTGP